MKDDPTLLRKAAKNKEIRKNKSRKNFAIKQENLKKIQAERQEKRQKNLNERHKKSAKKWNELSIYSKSVYKMFFFVELIFLSTSHTHIIAHTHIH